MNLKSHPAFSIRLKYPQGLDLMKMSILLHKLTVLKMVIYRLKKVIILIYET